MKFCKKCNEEKPLEEFYKKIRGKYTSFECKKCHKEYRLNNLDTINAKKKIYANTKPSFLLSSYYSMTGQYRRKIKNNFPKDKLKSYEVSISREDFLDMVNTYEKEKGFVCQGTNMPLTTLRNLNKNQKTCPTNFSVDRLDTQTGYSKNNIIFVSWEFNERKKSVRIEDCFTILKLYKERYPEKYESIKQGFKELFI
jgi:hypothetical protein